MESDTKWVSDSIEYKGRGTSLFRERHLVGSLGRVRDFDVYLATFLLVYTLLTESSDPTIYP